MPKFSQPSTFEYVQRPGFVPKSIHSEDTRLFNTQLPVDPVWKSSKRRLLIVCEFTDSEDFNSRFLSHVQGYLIDNLLNLAAEYSGVSVPALAAINYDYFRNRHLDGSQAVIAQNAASSRVLKYVESLKPTDIFVFGSNAAMNLMQISDYEEFMHRGRVRKIDGIYWSHSIDLSTAYRKSNDEADEETLLSIANLAGFASRCLGNCLARRYVHEIKPEVKYKVVDTIERWNKFYSHWKDTPRFALDTETLGLGRKINAIQTLQVAFNGNCGYIVPIEHQDSTFSKKERMQIYTDLRALIGRKIPLGTMSEFMLGQNLKFDLTILRQALDLQVITWPVWDCMAGEYLLDENMGANKTRLNGRNKTSYGLDWICSNYGCDFYDSNEFGKSDRGSIAEKRLEPAMLRYMAADVIVPWHIREQQLARAEKQNINGKPYTQAYQKMMLLQMSNMIHVQSMMEHRGDHLDIGWLQKLLSKTGPLSALEVEFEKAFRDLPSVKAVNARLLKAQGVHATSIFGSANWLFSVTKPAHKQMLFFDELELEPTSVGKSGAPSVDKEFQEKYKDVPEIQAFKTLAQVGKVRSTYVKGFLKKLETDPDMQVDHNLRPSFGYVETVTGRSNSYDPLFD